MINTVLKDNLQFLAILLLLFLVAACKKDDTDGQRVTDKGVYVMLDNSKWYLTRQGNGGSVSVKLNGTTNADKVTIVTVGDGLAGEYNLPLSSGKFNGDVGISFTATSVPAGVFHESTVLKAYKGTDTLKLTLNSGDLQY